MDELGLLLIPRVTNSIATILDRGDEKPKAIFTELIMEYTWVDVEEPTQTIVCPFYGQGIDFVGEKGVGKALTYAEKYFLLKFFNIPTDRDDPDSFQEKNAEPEEVPIEKEEKPKPPRPSGKKITEKQVKLVWGKAYGVWDDREEAQKEVKGILRGRYKIESTKDMTMDQLDDYLEYIERVAKNKKDGDSFPE
jgi:hypothetical protein